MELGPRIQQGDSGCVTGQRPSPAEQRVPRFRPEERPNRYVRVETLILVR